jgi:hypothetical protein
MKKTIKHLASAMAVAVFLVIAFGSGDDQTTESSVDEQKTETSSPESKKTTDCNGYGDERFIRSKMDEMDRDVLEFSKIGKRKYFVRYISWSTGTAINGDQILDYSNNPCND